MNCSGKLFDITQPLVMGILNITPDSFYDGGKHNQLSGVVSYVKSMLKQGADIIDIGAYSSRPGAIEISEKDELNRLEPVLDTLSSTFPDILISLDTFRAKVSDACLEKYNVSIINDISGGSIDKEIIDVAAKRQVPYITMHMQGTPKTMQKNPVYNHIVKDLIAYFSDHIARLREKGLNDIIIDPGFGFGKTLEHNYQLLAGLDAFQMLELPILVGLSRKSMVFKLINTGPEEALFGTIALNTIALQKGASILRVHDVKAAADTISIYKKLLIESEKSINLLKEL